MNNTGQYKIPSAEDPTRPDVPPSTPPIPSGKHQMITTLVNGDKSVEVHWDGTNLFCETQDNRVSIVISVNDPTIGPHGSVVISFVDLPHLMIETRAK